jgi:hypothetical protein
MIACHSCNSSGKDEVFLVRGYQGEFLEVVLKKGYEWSERADRLQNTRSEKKIPNE